MTPWSTKTIVVTGANAGLGFQLSLELGRTGAHVVMACRNAERAEAARRRLLDHAPDARITTLPLDLSDPESIQEFGRLVVTRVGPLDVLINNAGIFGVPPAQNRAGHEIHLATNYLGPFALTGTLLPSFRNVPGARIVNVGSLAHRFGKLHPDRLEADNADPSPWRVYARSKVALMAHTLELNRRLRESGSHIKALAAHPGFALTEMAKSPAVKPRTAIGAWFQRRVERWIPSAAAAALPILHAVLAEGVSGGDYFGPGGWLEIAGAPARARVSSLALDENLGRQLWAKSESLTGVHYLSPSGDFPGS
jgi:NAD(P)-dependent dehydrogenase (short-subunit alcohol dehydrogenase family)